MRAIHINQQSDKPIYQQLFDQIASQIVNQDLVKDTKLPSIRTAAKELRVSIITIKKAWELLEKENFIYTIAGKGSYVQDIKPSNLSIKKDKVIASDIEALINRCRALNISREDLVDIINQKYS